MNYFFNGLLFRRLLPPLLLLVLSSGRPAPVNADALVTGTVFCDQCKDGSPGLFDYPLSGARVAVACGGEYREEATNFLGCYSFRFAGSPDLTGCSARVVTGAGGCGEAAGPPQRLKLFFRMFGAEAYTVDPLLAQPSQPMGFCHRSPVQPMPWRKRRVSSPPPPVILHHPPPPLPKIPFFEASACSYDKWLMPQFKCHWRVVAPETAVAVAFGPVAAGKYGPKMTLWDGLHGRGDLYRTLLREATAALLNSYNSFGFFNPTLAVVTNMNLALLGSRREALMTALRFRRANSGTAGRSSVACNFTPCS